MKNQKMSLSKKTATALLAMTMVMAVGCGKNGGDSTVGGLASNRQNIYGLGPAGVSLAASGKSGSSLGSAGGYVILAKAGVSNVTGSMIVGNMGVSPAAASYITGFSLVAAPTNVYSTSVAVNGKIYAANYAVPTPSNLTTAVGAMETAYNDAAGRSDPDFKELASGNLSGRTLVPGLYKWSTSVIMPGNVTIAGSATDVWIFQVAGNLSMAAGMSITLSGGALAKNIFWQVAGQVDIFSSAHFEGIILSKTAVNLKTSASMNGRIYSQTRVSLDDNAITKP